MVALPRRAKEWLSSLRVSLFEGAGLDAAGAEALKQVGGELFRGARALRLRAADQGDGGARGRDRSDCRWRRRFVGDRGRVTVGWAGPERADAAVR